MMGYYSLKMGILNNAPDHFSNDFHHFLISSFPPHLYIKTNQMETAINTHINFETTQAVKNNTWNDLLATIDNQAQHKTLWYLFALVFQGVFFLPVPAVLMYYFHAPIAILPVTFGLYLGSIIVGMGGSGIRVVIGWFLLSALINLSMLAFFTL
jgi:hypothetical protein